MGVCFLEFSDLSEFVSFCHIDEWFQWPVGIFEDFRDLRRSDSHSDPVLEDNARVVVDRSCESEVDSNWKVVRDSNLGSVSLCHFDSSQIPGWVRC